ncbi:MAG: Hsp33 family molecular chaperone HslO [Lachnospiraceae bacterium]|jgi:molecular chaperone Hsp33|nr:Hsp33 family molecular chaperone HslO [Lachnospiraceae bacterium]
MEDYIIKAAAADYQIRAFAATTIDMVETARRAHNTSPAATAALGRLLTAGAMMGSMMKGEEDLLTLKIEGTGPIGGIVVTADSHGNVKGYVYDPEVLLPARADGKLDVSGAIGAGMLQVIQDVGLKEPYVGQIALVSGEIAEDLTYYYATSEQTPSSVALGVLMNRENTVRQAGGFIIQLLPGTDESVIGRLERKLSEITSVTAMLDRGMTPEDILKEVLGEFGLEILEKRPARFHCSCSKSRVEKAIVSLGEKDLKELVEEGEPMEVNCHFCNTSYTFTPEEMQAILDRGRAGRAGEV